MKIRTRGGGLKTGKLCGPYKWNASKGFRQTVGEINDVTGGRVGRGSNDVCVREREGECIYPFQWRLLNVVRQGPDSI